MVNSSVRHYARYSSGSSHVHLDSVGVLCVIGCGHIGRCDGVDDVKGEGGKPSGILSVVICTGVGRTEGSSAWSRPIAGCLGLGLGTPWCRRLSVCSSMSHKNAGGFAFFAWWCEVPQCSYKV